MRNENTNIRQAVASDIPFLVECIIAAEKSGTDKLSYCTIFDLAEFELRAMLAEILAEDIIGQELCVSGFFVAEAAGTLAGAVCAWVEGSERKPSGILKGNLLLHFLGQQKIGLATANLKLVEELSLSRTRGALQLESIFVARSYRGCGICGQLMAAQQKAAQEKHPEIKTAQIMLMKTNDQAYRAYEKSGFSIVAERASQSPGILDLLPAACKILMEKDVQ